MQRKIAQRTSSSPVAPQVTIALIAPRNARGVEIAVVMELATTEQPVAASAHAQRDTRRLIAQIAQAANSGQAAQALA